MAELLSDADVGLSNPQVTEGATAPTRVYIGDRQQPQQDQQLLSDADVGLSSQSSASQSFGSKIANLWEHPPPGPSLIGAARSLYDAVMTPGRVMKAADEQSQKFNKEITDSDIPITSQTLAAPAANMAQNIFLKAPGPVPYMKAPEKVVAPAYGVNRTQQKAGEIVTAPLKDRGLATSQSVEKALSDIGPEAVPADIDPRLAQMAGTLAAKPGPAQQNVWAPLDARIKGAPARIESTMNDIMGQPINIAQTSRDIYKNAVGRAGPLWSEAYTAPIQMTPDLAETLATPPGQTALSRARYLALSSPKGEKSVMFSPEMAAPTIPQTMTADEFRRMQSGAANSLGNMKMTAQEFNKLQAGPTTAQRVDVRGLHLVRQAFDDMIEKAGSPVTSEGRNKLGAIKYNRAVVDEVLKQVQPMAQADAIYANQAKINTAIDEGLNLFKNSRTPEDVAAQLNTMTEAEKAGYLQGARVAIRNLMGTARNSASAVRGTFKEGFNKEKLGLIMGQERADSILKKIAGEDIYAGTDNRVLRNSETGARLYGNQALEDAHGFPDLLSTVNYSSLHSIPRHLVLKQVAKALNSAKGARQQEIEAEVAKLLTMGRSNLSPVLQALYGEQNRLPDPAAGLKMLAMRPVLQRALAPVPDQTPAR